MTTQDDKQAYLSAQKKRNWYIAGGLVLWVLLIYFVTMVQMSRNTEAERTGADATASAPLAK